MYASWPIPKTKLKTNPSLIGHWPTLFSPVRQFPDIGLEMGPNSIGTMVVSISFKKDVTIKTDCLLLPVWLWMMWTWPYCQLMSCAMYVYYVMKCSICGVLLGCITKIACRLARLLGGNGSCKLQVRGVVSIDWFHTYRESSRWPLRKIHCNIDFACVCIPPLVGDCQTSPQMTLRTWAEYSMASESFNRQKIKIYELFFWSCRAPWLLCGAKYGSNHQIWHNRSSYLSVLFHASPSTALLEFLPPDEPISSCRSIPDSSGSSRIQQQLCDTLGRKKSCSCTMMIGVDSALKKVESGHSWLSCTMLNGNNETSNHLTSQGWTEQN